MIFLNDFFPIHILCHRFFFIIFKINQDLGLNNNGLRILNAESQTAFTRRRRDAYVFILDPY